MRLALLQGQAVEQPAQLTPGNLARDGAVIQRPTKAATLQATVIEPEAVVLPVQDLQLISFPIAEDEQGWRKGVQVEPLFNQNSKTVDGLAHVRSATGQVDLVDLKFV